MTSSVNSRGCGLVNRTRSSPSIAPGGPQQVGEGPPVAELDAVGVDVLPEQGHLEHALVDQRLHLGEDLAGPAVLLLAAQRRDDAERAGVVAAHADRHPPGVGGVPLGRQRRREDLERLDDLDLRLGVVPGPLQQRRQRAHVVRAEDDVHPRRAAHDLAAVLLREAAADGDLHAGVGVLDRPEVAEVAVEPVVGVLAHRAGVEDDDVGVAALGRGGVAGLLEEAGEALGVVHVHLAPVRAHAVGARRGSRMAAHVSSEGTAAASLRLRDRLDHARVQSAPRVRGVTEPADTENPSSACPASTSGSANCTCCRTSTWRSPGARSSSSSARPGRASPPCAGRSTGSSRSSRARSPSTASTLPDGGQGAGRLRADVGMVFQSFNLFAHKTVLENVTLGPVKVRRMSAADAEKRARELLDRVGVGQPGRQVPGAAVRRPAAARRHRPRPGHGPQGDALRRAHLGPGPRDDQRGPRRDGRPGPGRHDDGRRHPRDGLRPQGGQPGRVHGRRRDRRVRRPRDLLHHPDARTGPRTSCPRSSPTDRDRHDRTDTERTPHESPPQHPGRHHDRRRPRPRRLRQRRRRRRSPSPTSPRPPSSRPARRWPSWPTPAR